MNELIISQIKNALQANGNDKLASDFKRIVNNLHRYEKMVCTGCHGEGLIGSMTQEGGEGQECPFCHGKTIDQLVDERNELHDNFSKYISLHSRHELQPSETCECAVCNVHRKLRETKSSFETMEKLVFKINENLQEVIPRAMGALASAEGYISNIADRETTLEEQNINGTRSLLSNLDSAYIELVSLLPAKIESVCSQCGNPKSDREHDFYSEDCNHAFTTIPCEPTEHRTGTGCSSEEMNHEPEINNPDHLMPDQYEARDGWRLLSVDEIPDKGIAPDFCYFWNRFTKDWGVGMFVFIKSYTIRTKRTKEQMRQWLDSNSK